MAGTVFLKWMRAPVGTTSESPPRRKANADTSHQRFIFKSGEKGIGSTVPVNPTIIVDGQVGYLFEAEKFGSICFVPKDQVLFSADGIAVIDEVRYFQSGWALRNMRSTSIDSAGTYLFPNPGRLISDFSSARTKSFLSALASHSIHPFPASVAR